MRRGKNASMKFHVVPVCVILAWLAGGPALGDQKPQTAGQTENGFLLPNGWLLTPAGRHVVLTDLPLNIMPLSDNRHALVATSGYNKHELSMVDLSQQRVIASETAPETWFGLATNDDESRVWWSGGGGNRVHRFAVKAAQGKLKQEASFGSAEWAPRGEFNFQGAFL